MKRSARARLVGIGREVPEYVDRYATSGRIWTKAEIVEAQLRGVPLLDGERYGKALARRNPPTDEASQRTSR